MDISPAMKGSIVCNSPVITGISCCHGLDMLEATAHVIRDYAVEGFVDELRAQVDRIWSMQYVDRWKHFVYESFGEIRTDSERRRLRLVLDLSRRSIVPPDGIGLPAVDPVPRGELRHLSPQLAELYAGKTELTLTLDLDELLGRQLIARTSGGYTPASDSVLAFMPSARGRE